MGCGCGKAKVARPIGTTPTLNVQTRQTSQATVIAATSPYTAPEHLQKTIDAKRTKV